MFVSKAAIVGAGTMGGEIAQVIAAAGISVLLKDVDEAALGTGLDKARAVTDAQLGRLRAKQQITAEQAQEESERIMGRIAGTLDYDGFADVDFVLEAVPEQCELKQRVFAELDAVTPGHAILASNTSSLSIAEIGQEVLRPGRVVGFHFFNPASVMRLVEVIEGDDTAPDTVEAAVAFASEIRKLPITCLESPGFVVNRILLSSASEAWLAQVEGGLDPAAVDEAITAAGVAPTGPFLLADMVGLDVAEQTARHLHEVYGQRFYVHPQMSELVAQGALGVKAGRGFFDHRR